MFFTLKYTNQAQGGLDGHTTIGLSLQSAGSVVGQVLVSYCVSLKTGSCVSDVISKFMTGLPLSVCDYFEAAIRSEFGERYEKCSVKSDLERRLKTLIESHVFAIHDFLCSDGVDKDVKVDAKVEAIMKEFVDLPLPSKRKRTPTPKVKEEQQVKEKRQRTAAATGASFVDALQALTDGCAMTEDSRNDLEDMIQGGFSFTTNREQVKQPVEAIMGKPDDSTLSESLDVSIPGDIFDQSSVGVSSSSSPLRSVSALSADVVILLGRSLSNGVKKDKNKVVRTLSVDTTAPPSSTSLRTPSTSSQNAFFSRDRLQSFDKYLDECESNQTVSKEPGDRFKFQRVDNNQNRSVENNWKEEDIDKLSENTGLPYALFDEGYALNF